MKRRRRRGIEWEAVFCEEKDEKGMEGVFGCRKFVFLFRLSFELNLQMNKVEAFHTFLLFLRVTGFFK